MTPVERALKALRPLLGARLAARIRNNLPSRKPQLWEQFPQALFRRSQVALRVRFRRQWPGHTVVTSLPEFGVVMELGPSLRSIDLPLFLYGVYEISGTRFLQALLEPGMTVIDVGANGGYYSLVAARLVQNIGRVYALEPASVPFDRLKRNILLNGFRNVTIRQAAVGSQLGRSLFYPSADESNDGLGSLLPGRGRAQVGEEVPVISLDNLVEEIPGRRVHLIKVDVEGNEAEVFAGAGALLGGPEAPALLFESFEIAPVAQSLARLGYEVRHVHYSLGQGLEFPRLGEPFDNLYGAYEAPNYVALKPYGQFGTFLEISTRCKRRVRFARRVLAALA